MVRWRSFFLIVSLILFLQLNIGCLQESQRIGSSEYIPGEIILKLSPEACNEEGKLLSESIKTLNSRHGLISMEPLLRSKASREAYIYRLEFPQDVDMAELVQEYTRDPCVIYAEPNYKIRAIDKNKKP